DFSYWFRASHSPSEAAIVAMDDESHTRLKQPFQGAWDRTLHARIIEELGRLGARAVVFDVIFNGAPQPTADERLVAAGRAYGRGAVAAVVTTVEREGLVIGQSVEPPFDPLREVARWGVAERGDTDPAIRQPRRAMGPVESLAVVAARMIAGDQIPSPTEN